MLERKKFNVITAVLTAAAVLFAVIVVLFRGSIGTERESDLRYDRMLFGGNIMELNIIVDEDEWQAMIDNKMAKEYIPCDVEVNGERFDEVGIRPKGNSSLTSTQSSRIGFRFDFDHYITHQTCYGLTKFVINNIQADSTYYKDYIAYDLMQHEGVDAPLHTFANVKLNGEPFGVYLAAEVYDEEYLRRTYGDRNVRLYNVKGSGYGSFEDAVVDPETCEVISSNGMTDASSQGMGGPPGGGPPPGPPPGMDGGQMPPGMGGQMPSMGGEMQPPEMDGQMQPPEMSGEMQPPEMDGQMQPPEMDGQMQQPPEMGGEMQPPEMSGEMQPPEMDGQMQPPEMDGEMQQPPEMSGEMQPPPEMSGDMQPPEMGGGQMPGPPPGGGPGGGSGGDLVYTDDSTSSYMAIFANAVFDDTKAKDNAKVIRAIKYLNKENVTREELERYWDVDQILRYLAVHTFMVNGDSYTGSMQQNYYIAEQNGVIRILPWDYNLSFGSFGGPPPGGMGSTGGTGMDRTVQAVNFAIDTPVFESDVEDRPLVAVLLSFDEYREAYHYYLGELSEYVSGDFLEKLRIVENEIYPYIENDATAFYTPEEHVLGFETLLKFLALRAESVTAQTNGTIPSVTAEQTAENVLPADGISIDDMGSMGGGGGDGRGGPPQPPGMEGGQGGMMPPPGMEGGQGGMMPPPGMEGGQGGMMPPPGFGTDMNSGSGMNAPVLITMSAAAVLAAAAVMGFRRRY